MKTIKLKRTITLTTVVSLEVPENLTEESIIDALYDENYLFEELNRHTSEYQALNKTNEWDEAGKKEKVHLIYEFNEIEDALKEDGLIE